MIKGQLVTVRLYGGATAQRRVISDKGSVVVICTEEEFQSSRIEEREPEGLGFPREDVIEPVKKSPASEASHNEPKSMAGD